MSQAGVVGLEFRLDEFVAIQIHERDLAGRELIAEAGLVLEQLSVSMMPWPFADGH